jgi:peptidoglycan/xylan/chitin deacetylase (PgdA/CDA1 family)
MRDLTLKDHLRVMAHRCVMTTGVDRLAARRRAGTFIVLTAHNFTEESRVGYFGEQPIQPMITFLRRLMQHYVFHTLPGAHACLVGCSPPSDRPAAVLTIDDGYADNFEVLFPALSALGIPATFFVTTSFIDDGRPPWPVEIAAILRSATTKTLNWPEQRPVRTDWEKKQAAARLKLLWRALSATERNKKMDELRQRVGAKHLNNPRPMTWDQVRAIRNAGHTIGSHTHWHGILTDLTDPEVRLELSFSKARLESELSVPCEFFAYPNGDADARTARLVDECGYVGAFTQTAGVSQFGEHPLLRPRINLPPYETAASLSFRTAIAA